jgi:hypothetical protein
LFGLLTILLISENHFVKVIEAVKCTGKEHLHRIFKDVTGRQGEGLVLRKPSSIYLDPFYKLEEQSSDLEVLVTDASNLLDVHAVSPFGAEITFDSPYSLKKGDIVTIHNCKGSKTVWTFYQHRKDLSWSEICKRSLGFFVGRGLSSRATCRGCRKQFEKDELRVKSKLTIVGVNPQVVDISFCFSTACITRAVKKYGSMVGI